MPEKYQTAKKKEIITKIEEIKIKLQKTNTHFLIKPPNTANLYIELYSNGSNDAKGYTRFY